MNKPDPTFSKSIMSSLLFVYFVGVMLGGYLVLLAANTNTKLGLPIDPAMFIAYAAYIGGPTATAIGFYAWKSKAENLLKISQSVSNGRMDPSLIQQIVELKGDGQ